MPRPMPWSTKLTHPLVLTDGTQLVTFKDTIEALIRLFAESALSDQLDQAIGLLVKADTTRKPADIEVATSEIESLLRARRLIQLAPAHSTRVNV